MRFEVYNKSKNNLKVAFFCKSTFGTTLTEQENIDLIANYNNLEIHLFDTENQNFANFKSLKEHKTLNKNKSVCDIYDFILNYLKRNDISTCIFFGSGYPWTSIFLNKLKKFSYVACYFGDDPEGSGHTSEYYVKNYHYAFCGGIYFDSKKHISEKYVEWGARKSKFVPLGANPDKYKESAEIDKNRDVEIIYVGGAYLRKILRVFRLKKHFGGRMRLYGRGWNYNGNNIVKALIVKLIKSFYHIAEIEELPKDKLIGLYQKSKIGFNMHMSYGPSNLRLYELPMNGVMQVCDCEKGLEELYKIDKEVISYRTTKEVIKKIEYYLKHNKKRKKVARAGYERARKNYKLEIIFGKIKEEILADIRKNFIRLYKIND